MEQGNQIENRTVATTDTNASSVQILLSLCNKNNSHFNPHHRDETNLSLEFDVEVFNFLWKYEGRLKPEDFVDATNEIAWSVAPNDRDTRKTLVFSVLCGHKEIEGLEKFGRKTEELYFKNYF